MLQQRQKLILQLLQALGGDVANTDFQKLLFLFTREFQYTPVYDFVPYKYGGFSFTSYADKRRLSERGLLEDDDCNWRITASGQHQARPDRPMAVALHRFCRMYGALRGNALLASVYRRYPYYATRSEIVHKVLPDADSRRRITQATPVGRAAGLLTIGYEGKTLESFLNQLLLEGVTVLCDVRRNAISRKYGFSKSTLANACQNVGIRYEHLPELGIPSRERQELRTQADYDALFAAYERKHLPTQTAALEKLGEWIRDDQRLALACFELRAQQCHRHCIAKVVTERLGEKFPLLHLEEVCRGNAC